MSELIYNILDFEKVNNALKKALLRCNELETAKKTEYDE